LDHMAFLAPFAADQGLAAMSIRYIVLAMLALGLGRYLGTRLGPPRISRFGKVNVIATERVRLALAGLIGLIILGIYLFGIQEFMSGYATASGEGTGDTGNALVYITLELMGLSAAYAMVLGRSTGRTPGKFLMVTCLIISLAVLAIRAKRLEVVSAFLPPVLVFISRRSSI